MVMRARTLTQPALTRMTTQRKKKIAADEAADYESFDPEASLSRSTMVPRTARGTRAGPVLDPDVPLAAQHLDEEGVEALLKRAAASAATSFAGRTAREERELMAAAEAETARDSEAGPSTSAEPPRAAAFSSWADDDDDDEPAAGAAAGRTAARGRVQLVGRRRRGRRAGAPAAAAGEAPAEGAARQPARLRRETLKWYLEKELESESVRSVDVSGIGRAAVLRRRRYCVEVPNE